MRRPKAVAAALALGALAGTVVIRRRSAKRRERVDVYFEDGSMVSFAEGATQAEVLFPVARRALHAARP